ncbi:MAG: 3-deoxy-D-manno-octulosonic acid transferase [Bdellovibrionales bacterium]
MSYVHLLFHWIFYRWVFFPITLLFLYVVAPFHDKLQRGLDLRKKQNGLYPWQTITLKNALWIHVSSGEFEYAKPLIASLKSHAPELKIVVSFFSPSVKKVLANDPLIDGYFPLPFDHPFFLAPLFRHLKPRMLLVARTDLWPELLLQAKKYSVKTILFSATLSETAPKFKNPLKRSYAKWRFQLVDEIYCVDDEDKKTFESLALRDRTQVFGDTRYDQVLRRLAQPRALRSELHPPKKYVTFLAGSTWLPDEEVLKETLQKLQGLPIRFIIAPHEPTPDHLAQLKKLFQDLSIKTHLYTEAKSDWYLEPSVLIINQVGILADLYSWAQLALVGNSFLRDKIHSVMEPLAAGCITFVGPKHRNNREALIFQKLLIQNISPAVIVVQNSEELAKNIQTLIKVDLASVQHHLKNKVLEKTGASEKLAQKILFNT